MDSMRNLRTSLPSTARRHASQPPEELMQAFKQAALSVTNLYKTAASEQARGYQEGYQDALEELLRFLDKENLGLQDGEGWRVRQWATERYQGSNRQTHVPSENEEDAEDDARGRSSSPIDQRKENLHASVPQAQDENASAPTVAPRSESAPPMAPPGQTGSPIRTSAASFAMPTADFTFQSTLQPPATHDIDMSNGDANPNGNPNNANTFQINLIPRQSRTPRRDSRNTSTRLGPGAGTKRGFPTIDFFDIGGFDTRDGRDKDGSNGGGKRGRFA